MWKKGFCTLHSVLIKKKFFNLVDSSSDASSVRIPVYIAYSFFMLCLLPGAVDSLIFTAFLVHSTTTTPLLALPSRL